MTEYYLMTDQLARLEAAIKFMREVRTAAFKLGYCEGRFHRHVEGMSDEEKRLLTDVMARARYIHVGVEEKK